MSTPKTEFHLRAAEVMEVHERATFMNGKDVDVTEVIVRVAETDPKTQQATKQSRVLLEAWGRAAGEAAAKLKPGMVVDLQGRVRGAYGTDKRGNAWFKTVLMLGLPILENGKPVQGQAEFNFGREDA